MAPAASSQARQAAAGAGAAETARAGVSAGGAAAASPGRVGQAAGVGVAAVTAGLITFLAALRTAQRRWLAANLPRYSSSQDVILATIADEQARGEVFAHRSVQRVAEQMPAALSIADPDARERAVRQILETEQRYAQDRSEAMAARAISALTRWDLRAASPAGAFWQLGHAINHTEGCKRMAGKFWPWAVLDRVHPPRHYGCTSRLHGYDEAIEQGLMSPGDVPDTRAAIRAASGVVMEAEDADRLLAELEVRDRLADDGVPQDVLDAIPLQGIVLEAFANAEHPRDWKGRFRKVGEVGATTAQRSMAWQQMFGGKIADDAPSIEQIGKNFTKQFRGRLSQDRSAIAKIAAAEAENAKNPLWRRVVAAAVPDHVVVSKLPAEGRMTSMVDTVHGAHRLPGTTVIPDKNVHIMEADSMRSKHVPVNGENRAEASSGYGLAAILRHEYGHSIDDNLPRDTRRGILDAIPDPSTDLSYYSGFAGNQEVIPELLALITHPDYRASNWPATVQEAERRLLAALGVKRTEEGSHGGA